MKDKILQKAAASFMKYGFKSVSMDDIARELGISKKTLYQYFENKEDLIFQTLESHIEEESCRNDLIRNASRDALDALLRYAQHDIMEFQEISPSAVYDLKKYYPQAWEMVEKKQTVYGIDAISHNLERGIAEGLYRSNLKPRLVAPLYITIVNTMFDEKFFPRKQFRFEEVFRELIHLFIQGIVSEKGQRRLSQYLQEMEANGQGELTSLALEP